MHLRTLHNALTQWNEHCWLQIGGGKSLHASICSEFQQLCSKENSPQNHDSVCSWWWPRHVMHLEQAMYCMLQGQSYVTRLFVYASSIVLEPSACTSKPKSQNHVSVKEYVNLLQMSALLSTLRWISAISLENLLPRRAGAASSVTCRRAATSISKLKRTVPHYFGRRSYSRIGPWSRLDTTPASAVAMAACLTCDWNLVFHPSEFTPIPHISCSAFDNL